MLKQHKNLEFKNSTNITLQNIFIYFCLMAHMLILKCLWNILFLQTPPLWSNSILDSLSNLFSKIYFFQLWEFWIGLFAVISERTPDALRFDDSTTWKTFKFEQQHSLHWISFFISSKILLHIQTLKTLNWRKDMNEHWCLRWHLHCKSCYTNERDNDS